MPIELPPPGSEGQISVGPPVPDRLLRRLADGAGVLMFSRSSSVGGDARRAAPKQLRTAARRLRAYGIDVETLIPTDDALIAAQMTNRRTTTHARQGQKPFTLNVTAARVRNSNLTIVLITGSGAQLDDYFIQPAIHAAAEVVEQTRPFLTIVPELTRVGRDGFGFAPFAHAFRRLERHFGEPAWLAYEEDASLESDPNAMRIEAFSKDTERRLFEAGQKGRAFVDKFASQASGGALTTLLQNP